jgi:hypothetical protein
MQAERDLLSERGAGSHSRKRSPSLPGGDGHREVDERNPGRIVATALPCVDLRLLLHSERILAPAHHDELPSLVGWIDPNDRNLGQSAPLPSGAMSAPARADYSMTPRATPLSFSMTGCTSGWPGSGTMPATLLIQSQLSSWERHLASSQLSRRFGSASAHARASVRDPPPVDAVRPGLSTPEQRRFHQVTKAFNGFVDDVRAIL